MLRPTALFVGLVALVAWGPGGHANSDQQAIIGRALLATVVDARNRPLVDLGADDFVVTDGGRNSEILSVHLADYPVVVLVDDSGAAALQPAKDAVGRFVERIGQRPVAIGSLTRADTAAASFAGDRLAVRQAIERLSPNGNQPQALQAVAHASRLLQKTEAAFSAIVIVAAKPLDASQPPGAELLPSIVEGGAAISVVVNLSSGNSVGADSAPDLLRVLTDQTAGQYTGIYSTSSFASALDRLADRFAAQLMIEYAVPAGSPSGDVKAGVRVPGARVVGFRASK